MTWVLAIGGVLLGLIVGMWAGFKLAQYELDEERAALWKELREVIRDPAKLDTKGEQ